MTLEAKGLQPNERRPLSILVKDAYGKTVEEIANGGIAADGDGNWTGTFPLKSDTLGFRRVCVSSGDLTLPKMGSRPKGCLTYAVFANLSARPRLGEEECFFGLQGGDNNKWVGAHWQYSSSNPLTDPEKSKAYQQRLLTQEFPVYGTIAAEYRFVKPFMTKEAVAYFESRRKDAPRMPFSFGAGDAVGERYLRESLKTYAAAAKMARPGRRIYEFALECDINSPDPETTVRCFKAAYEAIHEADPEAQVFAAGVSNVTKLDYMRRLFDFGLAPYMDGFNIHPYTPYPPDRHGFVENIRAFVKLVRERKGDVPLISTEQGFAAPYAEEVKQMEGNVRVALILLGEGFSLHCAFWGYDFGNDHYNWFDGDYGYTYNLELKTRRWSGLNSPRPSISALSAACLFLDGKRCVTPIEGLGETALGYAYAGRDGKCVLALWDHGGEPHEIWIPVGRDEVAVADIMGNVTRRKTKDGLLQLTLTGSPCYVLDPDPALWGREGTMKAQIAKEIAERRVREEAARQAQVLTVLPAFFDGVPGVKVEVENRVSSARTYRVETRIPGLPAARRTVELELPANGKGWASVPFGAPCAFDPSEIREIAITVSFGDTYRTTHKAKVNFLCAAYSGERASRPFGACAACSGERASRPFGAEQGANGRDARSPKALDWPRLRRFRWPVENGQPKVWSALGWTREYLLVEVAVYDDVFSNRHTGFDTWRGDSVQLGIAKTELREKTGNFQTDVQEEARSEITLALTKNGPSAYRTETFDPARFPADIKGGGEIPAAELPREIRVATNGADVVIRYRAAIPWRFMNIRDPQPGQVIRLAAFANDNDGESGMGRSTRWFELKNAAPKGFACVTLGDKECASFTSGKDFASPLESYEIGQSQKPGTPPVAWTACAWCVADKGKNVFLPDGWRIPCNGREAEKCESPFGSEDTLFSDGCGNIWSWNCRSGEVCEVRVNGRNLERGKKVFATKSWEKYTFFVAPPGLKSGFAAKAKFGAFVRYRGEIRGYDENGNDIGTIFSCAAAGLKVPYCAAFHPKTGELLVGNEWPDRHVHCFAANGQEVQTGVWPHPHDALAINSVDGNELYFSSGTSERIGETLVASKRLIFGECATETYALADGGDGWWLATTQGAQHYLKADPSHCDRRIGGVANADRIGIKDGQVLIADGKRLYKFWLDARADEIACSTERARVSGKTMPADLPTEVNGWRVAYDDARKAVRVTKDLSNRNQKGLCK